MVLKSFLLKGLARTNTDERRYDSKVVPSGEKWTVREVRVFTSRTHNLIDLFLYRDTMRIFEINAQVNNIIRQPYPSDIEIPAGSEIRLTGITDGVSTDHIVEIICEVATA